MVNRYLVISAQPQKAGRIIAQWAMPYPAALERDDESLEWLVSLLAEGGKANQLLDKARSLHEKASREVDNADSRKEAFIAQLRALALTRIEAGLRAIADATGNPRVYVSAVVVMKTAADTK